MVTGREGTNEERLESENKEIWMKSIAKLLN